MHLAVAFNLNIVKRQSKHRPEAAYRGGYGLRRFNPFFPAITDKERTFRREIKHLPQTTDRFFLWVFVCVTRRVRLNMFDAILGIRNKLAARFDIRFKISVGRLNRQVILLRYPTRTDKTLE